MTYKEMLKFYCRNFVGFQIIINGGVIISRVTEILRPWLVSKKLVIKLRKTWTSFLKWILWLCPVVVHFIMISEFILISIRKSIRKRCPPLRLAQLHIKQLKIGILEIFGSMCTLMSPCLKEALGAVQVFVVIFLLFIRQWEGTPQVLIVQWRLYL